MGCLLLYNLDLEFYFLDKGILLKSWSHSVSLALFDLWIFNEGKNSGLILKRCCIWSILSVTVYRDPTRILSHRLETMLHKLQLLQGKRSLYAFIYKDYFFKNTFSKVLTCFSRKLVVPQTSYASTCPFRFRFIYTILVGMQKGCST